MFWGWADSLTNEGYSCASIMGVSGVLLIEVAYFSYSA